MMTINILLEIDSSYERKAKYTFEALAEFIGVQPFFIDKLPDREIHIYYGSNQNNNAIISIYHSPEAATFYKKRDPYDPNKVHYEKYDDVVLPFLFSTKLDVSTIFCELPNGHLYIYQDIISSAFYFLSCWQEYAAKDEFYPGYRFDFKKSLQYYGGFTIIPVVDYYADILKSCIKKTLPNNALPIQKHKNIEHLLHSTSYEYYKGELFCTHDIDYFDYWTKNHLKDTYIYNLKRIFRSPIAAIYKIIGHFFTKQLIWNPQKELNKIYLKEAKLGVTSTSFLMVKADNDKRQGYFEEKEQLLHIQEIFKDKAIGLHGSMKAAFDENVLKQEFELLKTTGYQPNIYRNHYLCFDYQTTFSLLEKAGFVYDTTLGFWEHCGYRAGTGHPFHPYNLSEDKPFKIIELPLIIMDATLINQNIMNLSYRKAKKLIFQIIDTAHRIGSPLTILWHNNRFDIIDYPWLGKLYWDIIKKLQNSY